MALNTYGKINYEVDVPMSIEYSKTMIHPSGGRYGSEPQFMYSRHVTKTYRFKGMDMATAQDCLKAKKAQYCRKFMGWRLLGSNWYNKWYYARFGNITQAPSDYFQQVANFNVIRKSGAPVFDIQITINEVVNIYVVQDYDVSTVSGINHVETLFQKNGNTGGSCYVSTYDYDEDLT